MTDERDPVVEGRNEQDEREERADDAASSRAAGVGQAGLFDAGDLAGDLAEADDEADRAGVSARALRAAAYVDGELEPAEALAFEAEMARDPALAAEVEALGRLESLARSFASPPPVAAGAWAGAWGRIEARAFEGGAALDDSSPADEDAGPTDPAPEALSGYLDGELEAADRARLEARLAAEPALAADLAGLAAVDRWARAAAAPPPVAADRWERLWRVIEQRTFGRAAAPSGRILALPRSRRLTVRALSMAAGLLMAVSVALTLATYPGPDARERAVARAVGQVTIAVSEDAEALIDGAPDETALAFSSDPDANRVRILDLRTSAGVHPQILISEDDASRAVGILLN